MRIAAKATKGKGKQWKRGQSSSSNPSSNKFRSRVKAFNSKAGNIKSNGGPDNSLTINALANHNAFNLENLSLGMEEDDDRGSVQSFASAWSKCTNPSFDRFLNGWQSSSPLHKEMLAVLSSVTETIKANGGKETETEYFAVLSTTMGTVATEEGLTSVAQLLRIVLKRVPPGILKLKFSEVSKLLVDHLEKYASEDNGTLLRALIASLATFLRAQDEATWSLSSTQRTFTSLLTFCEHRKPRVRKTAHHAVVGIIKGSSISGKVSYHPAAQVVANFCIHQMEETGLKEEFGKILHSIALLKDVLGSLPHASIKTSCETMLRFMTLGNVLILTCCFKAFHAMFSAKPKCMTPELNVQILLALQDFQPSVSDSQPLSAWLTVVHEAMNCLHSLHPQLYYKHALAVVEIYVTCWLSDAKQVQSVVASNMKAIIANCVRLEDEKLSKDALLKCCAAVQSCLSYQYNNSWNSVFSVIATIFELVGKKNVDISKNCLKLLSNLRESDHFAHGAELDKAVATAVQFLGPEIVLKAIPLNSDLESGEFSRSWLLIILRDNIVNARLAFFNDYFIPLASKARLLAESLKACGRTVDGKSMSVYYAQLWSLLPSICNKPIDVAKSFNPVAKEMGKMLKLDSDHTVRPSILSALRMLLRTCEDPEDLTELAKYAKNFLPLLLSLYTAEPVTRDSDDRLAILSTISQYIKITDSTLVITVYRKLIEKLSEKDTDSFIIIAVLDLIRVFTPYLQNEQVEEVYQRVVVDLISTEGKSVSEQKKGYRLLEEICKAQSEECLKVVEKHLAKILTLLIHGLKSSPAPAKSAPLKALSALIQRYFSEAPQDARQVIFNILPLVVDCLLIKTSRTQIATVELLKILADALAEMDTGLNDLHSFVLLALQQESFESRSASVEAMGHLLPTLKKSFPMQNLRTICNGVLDLFTTDNRSVVQAVLNFVKALFRELEKDDLMPFLEKIIINMDSLSVSNRKHFRIPIKEIFVRLCRKFGSEMVTKMVPESFSKVLRNVRKVEARKARKKDKEDEESAPQHQTALSDKDAIDVVLRDSSDDEEMDDDDYGAESARPKSGAWIEEKGDEEVLDLLSNKANRKILSTNPFKAKLAKIKKDPAFETAADGRIIIKDNNVAGEASTDARSGGGRSSRKRAMQDSDEEIEENESQDEEEAEAGPSPAAKYQHGGQGIHRIPIKKRQKERKSSAAGAPEIKTGKEYRSAKARGDMKKKDLPDPYAYVPLHQQALNRRKRAKYAGQFKNIMNAAKRGASAGSRQNSNRQQRKK